MSNEGRPGTCGTKAGLWGNGEVSITSLCAAGEEDIRGGVIMLSADGQPLLSRAKGYTYLFPRVGRRDLLMGRGTFEGFAAAD